MAASAGPGVGRQGVLDSQRRLRPCRRGNPHLRRLRGAAGRRPSPRGPRRRDRGDAGPRPEAPADQPQPLPCARDPGVVARRRRISLVRPPRGFRGWRPPTVPRLRARSRRHPGLRKAGARPVAGGGPPGPPAACAMATSADVDAGEAAGDRGRRRGPRREVRTWPRARACGRRRRSRSRKRRDAG